jgi:hypothetical protein
MNALTRNKLLWILTTLLTLAAAVLGVVVSDFYGKVISADLVPAGYAQDLLTIVICLALLVLILTTKEGEIAKQVIILGIIGSFFYLYGIFVIERVYTLGYFLYLAIFSLSFWSMIFSVGSLKGDLVQHMESPAPVRAVSAGFSFLIAAIFCVLWVSALLPLVSTGRKIEYLYSIYILDLCLVMPAFVITAIMVLRRQGMGLLLSPAMFIVGIFVIFPLGLGELAKPFYGMAVNTGSMVMSFVLAAAFIAMAAVSLGNLKGAMPKG